MRNSAAIVLTVFCGLVCLQLGCTGGWLSHCDGQDGHEGHSDLCAQDLCGEDYSLPGKLKIKQIDVSDLLTLAPAHVFPMTDSKREAASSRPFFGASCSSPSGSFPLLI